MDFCDFFGDTVNYFCLQNTVGKFHRWMAFHLNILDLDKIVESAEETAMSAHVSFEQP